MIGVGCGFQSPEGLPSGAIGLVNGGGGLEDLDAAPLGHGSSDAEVSDGTGGHGGGTAEGGEDAAASESQDATATDANAGDGYPPPIEDAGEASDSGDGAVGHEEEGDGAAGADAGSSSDAAGIADAPSVDGQAGPEGGDAGAGSVVLSIGGAHLSWLDWAINGPNTYTGAVTFGDAQSVEWIIGGIEQGVGYTVTVTAADTSGDPCTGTSTPFDVEPGQISSTTLTIDCALPQAPDVTTGSVAIDASVVVTGP